jgi:hypothetical protein
MSAAANDELVRKRREIIARRRDLKAELTKLARDVAAVDRVLVMLDPDYRPERSHTNVRRISQPSPFGFGEMTEAALDALRRLGRPVSAAECAKAMLEAKQISDAQVVLKLTSKVAAVFAQKATLGQLRRSSNGDGRHVLWEINR